MAFYSLSTACPYTSIAFPRPPNTFPLHLHRLAPPSPCRSLDPPHCPLPSRYGALFRGSKADNAHNAGAAGAQTTPHLHLRLLSWRLRGETLDLTHSHLLFRALDDDAQCFVTHNGHYGLTHYTAVQHMCVCTRPFSSSRSTHVHTRTIASQHGDFAVKGGRRVAMTLDCASTLLTQRSKRSI